MQLPFLGRSLARTIAFLFLPALVISASIGTLSTHAFSAELRSTPTEIARGAALERVTGRVTITESWARATMPGQPVGAAYMKISSPFHMTLSHVETDAAEHVQVHSMHMHDGVMQMRALDEVDIPADKEVELSPGRTHLMLLGLKNPLKAGDAIPIRLTFTRAGKEKITVVVTVPVRSLGR